MFTDMKKLMRNMKKCPSDGYRQRAWAKQTSLIDMRAEV